MPTFGIGIRLVAVALLILMLAGVVTLIPNTVASRLAEWGAELAQRLSMTGSPETLQQVLRNLLGAVMSTGVLVVVPLALVLMLAMQYVAEPSKLLQGFVKSLAEALNLCRVFIITGHRGRELLPAFLKPAPVRCRDVVPRGLVQPSGYANAGPDAGPDATASERGLCGLGSRSGQAGFLGAPAGALRQRGD